MPRTVQAPFTVTINHGGPGKRVIPATHDRIMIQVDYLDGGVPCERPLVIECRPVNDRQNVIDIMANGEHIHRIRASRQQAVPLHGQVIVISE